MEKNENSFKKNLTGYQASQYAHFGSKNMRRKDFLRSLTIKEKQEEIMKNKGFILIGLFVLFASLSFAQLYTENFDGLFFPPTGWTPIGVVRVNDTVTIPHSYPYCVEFDASADQLITPLMENPASIEYWHKKGTGNYRYYIQYQMEDGVPGPDPNGTWTDFLLTDFVPPLAANAYPIWAANAWTGGNSPITINLSNYNNIYLRWIPQSTPPPAKIFYLDSVSIYLEEDECEPPTIQATNVTFPYIGINSLGIQWTRGNGDYCVAFLHEGPGVPDDPIDGTVYDPSTDWTMPGTQLGTSGYYCIYRGTGNSVTVNNLLPLTSYYVVVFEFNCDGVEARYLYPGAQNLAPTVPIELSSFTAWVDQQYFVELHWTTQSESDVDGYMVYRNHSNDFGNAYFVNPRLIPASNSSVETNYTFVDKEATPGTWYYWLEVKNLNGISDFFGPISVTITDATGSTVTPGHTSLSTIFPNPFNPGGTYLTGTYSLNKADNVLLAIYNIKGEKVRTIASGNKNAGSYPISWNGFNDNDKMCPTGVYYLVLKTGDSITTRKIVMIK